MSRQYFFTGTAAPATIPPFAGSIFVDTTGGRIYFGTGTSSSADWDLMPVGTLISLSDVNLWTGQQNFQEATLVDGANISWNLNTEQTATVTLAGNRTLDNPTNLVAGGKYNISVIQDGVGSRTLAFDTVYKFAGGVAPTLSTAIGAVDEFMFRSNGTNMNLIASALDVK